MDLLISNIITTFLGLVIGVILEKPLTKTWEKMVALVKKPFRKPIPQNIPFYFSFGNIETELVIIDGDGQAAYSPNTINCYYDPMPIPLPAEIEKIREKIVEREQTKKLTGQTYMWNGPTYAFKGYTRGRTALWENLEAHLWFGPSDWFTFVATNMSLDEKCVNEDSGKLVTLREKYLSDYKWNNPGLQPRQPFANTFSVNVSLVTSDNRLILIKRSDEVAVGKGQYSIAINETVQRIFDRADSHDGPNLYRTVIRGAAEELGIELKPLDITFFTICVKTLDSTWSMHGTARTDKTLDEIVASRRLCAKDRWEGEEIIPLEFDLKKVVQFVKTHTLFLRKYTPFLFFSANRGGF